MKTFFLLKSRWGHLRSGVGSDLSCGHMHLDLVELCNGWQAASEPHFDGLSRQSKISMVREFSRSGDCSRYCDTFFIGVAVNVNFKSVRVYSVEKWFLLLMKNSIIFAIENYDGLLVNRLGHLRSGVGSILLCGHMHLEVRSSSKSMQAGSTPHFVGSSRQSNISMVS